ncbi:asparagine synthase [Natronolimnobius sp. AArcel1]|uniref:asparagine synthase-related protein n=1 Tax=Natronolimnobius sp. AArcel1 TaxID=1679093 RepID=UPI0013EBDF91|nr:asparagine synthase-related protein [Natronolimnobius sp. AArcel1]NGM67690.1 asparagine synthase [Natronolimnobius sp. AArcel1]
MQTTLCGPDWTRVDEVAVRGRAFADGRLLQGEALATYLLDAVETAPAADPLEAVAEAAAELEGFYAAVVSTDESTTLIADGARSIPLYYDVDSRVVSDRGRVVRDTTNADRNPVTESEFLLTRYVTGPETIWCGVRAVQPGEVVRLEDGTVRRQTYREYWPDGSLENGDDRTERANGTDHATRLEAALEIALDRLERVAGDRPIVLSLSGGYDSRLLAASLVERGREVIGFTFGRSGHPDVEMSREVASRLGIRWEFVPYDEALWAEWYHGEVGQQYRTQAFGGDALPFLAEWPALRLLLEDERLPTDALYCPGHTVATPSERLPVFAGESRGDDSATGAVGCGSGDEGSEAVTPSLEGLLEYILEIHYSLWGWDDDAFRAAARERIRRGLLGERDSAMIDGPASAAAAYERWEWRGRMSTFTNGDLRTYENADVDWWLPLWDPAYVRAWQQVPLEHRREKRAHANLAVDRYRTVADVPTDRASITDRTLSPVDRHLALVRHTPAQQFTERGGEWDPPYLAPREAWSEPGQHPLAWDGAVDNALLERLPTERGFYALRTLAETGRLDLSDGESTTPDSQLSLPTDDPSDSSTEPS